jgi:hypothetical protein
MSRWTTTGSATIIREAIPHVTDDDRNTRGYERIRAKASYPEPVSSRAEAYAARQNRLAKRRGDCPRCDAVRGQRCWDLALLPTRAYALGFHRGRPMLPPPAATVPMERVRPGRQICACGHRAREHKHHEGYCGMCKGACRKFKRRKP